MQILQRFYGPKVSAVRVVASRDFGNPNALANHWFNPKTDC